MQSKLHILEGIVLGTKSFNESDKLITLFTREHGKTRAIAKGIKKLTSRKRASLEVFTHVRFQATKHELGIITEASPLHHFTDLRHDLKRVAVGYFLCEAINRTIADEAPHPEIFVLLLNSLKALDDGKNTKKIREEFTRSLLVHLGYVPLGEYVPDPLVLLEEVTEKRLGTVRVGKQIQ